jgi:hypothetical protein
MGQSRTKTRICDALNGLRRGNRWKRGVLGAAHFVSSVWSRLSSVGNPAGKGAVTETTIHVTNLALREAHGSFFPLRNVLGLRVGVRRLRNLERPRRRGLVSELPTTREFSDRKPFIDTDPMNKPITSSLPGTRP